jgi:hypothetical protein
VQVDGSCSSADIPAERHESERLAVNLAVNQPLQPKDANLLAAYTNLVERWTLEARFGQHDEM